MKGMSGGHVGKGEAEKTRHKVFVIIWISSCLPDESANIAVLPYRKKIHQSAGDLKLHHAAILLY